MDERDALREHVLSQQSIDAIKEGVQAMREGRVQLWSEVEREINAKPRETAQRRAGAFGVAKYRSQRKDRRKRRRDGQRAASRGGR